MAILLVRHGETALNAARVMQPPDTALSARGVAQAQALGRRLALRGGVGAILSSDLPRALDTAAAGGRAGAARGHQRCCRSAISARAAAPTTRWASTRW